VAMRGKGSLRLVRCDMMQPTDGAIMGDTHMRCIVLLVSMIFALTFPALGQSEPMTIEQMQIPRLGGRTIFVLKPTTDNVQCPSIDPRATTQWMAPRLGRTILAEALVYSSNAVGYVFLVSYGNGAHEVYFSSYTQRACALTESQSHQRVFVTDNRFNEAKAYYHSLLSELLE